MILSFQKNRTHRSSDRRPIPRFGGRPLVWLALACLPAFAACSSSSSNSTPSGDPPPVATIAPLSHYTPFGPGGGIEVPYWKRHVRDDAGHFDFSVELDAPVPAGGATLDVQWSGTALPGVHYLLPPASAYQLAEGTTKANLRVTLIASGEYFLERYLELQVRGTIAIEVDPQQARAQLWIRPAVDPPTLSIGQKDFLGAPGDFVQVPMSLSHVSQEAVRIHYRIDPTSTLTDHAVAQSGSLLFQPGELNTQWGLVLGPMGQSGQTLILNLEHERNGVRYTIPGLDPMLANGEVYPDQPIHLDENMWTYSVGGVQALEHHPTRNPPPSGIVIPGVPSDLITGGSFWEPGREDEELVDLVDQSNPNPITDPFSGIPLKMYTIAPAATGVVPYLRKSFDSSFCGSTPQLYTLPEYARISYYLRLPEGPDAARAVPFVRIGMRFRSLNFNHGVTFRIGSDGFDSQGQPVSVTQTSLGPIGVWDTLNINPATDRYGVIEDEFGVRFWHAHHLDPSVAWTHDQTGATIFEVPGQTSGNPIEYPTWVSTGDGSLATMGLSTVDDATGRGNLPYGFFWEISETDEIFNGNLKPYFPKPGNWWEPQGNAVLDQTTSLRFTVQ